MKKIIMFFFAFGMICLGNIKSKVIVNPEKENLTFLGTYDNGLIRKNLYNDLPSLLFVIEEMEDILSTNIYQVTEVNNIVLGYIRSINKQYTGSLWSSIMGNTHGHLGVYPWINNSSQNFKIYEYFASFLKSIDLYNPSHKKIEESSLGNIKFGTFFIDPLHPENTLNSIDLLHFIAVIDGTYEKTGGNLISDFAMEKGFEKDLSGWAGDLQTFAYSDIYLNRNNQSQNQNYMQQYIDLDKLDNRIIDFGIYNGLNDSTFSSSDLLGDIDGMNIGKLLDQGYLLSSAIKEYYNTTQMDNLQGINRYRKFIKSVNMETNYQFADPIKTFKSEVLYSMALKYDNEYITGEDVSLISGTYYLLKGNNAVGLGVPDPKYRIYCANLFIDYILEMSTPPIYEVKEVNCQSINFIFNGFLEKSETILFQINVECRLFVELIAVSSNKIKLAILDSELNQVPLHPNSGDGIKQFQGYLDQGKYFIQIEFHSLEEKNSFRFESNIQPSSNLEQIYKNQDFTLNNHPHNVNRMFYYISKENEEMLQIVFKFIRDGKMCFPNREILIKDENFRILEIISFSDLLMQENKSNITYNLNLILKKNQKIYIEFESQIIYDEIHLRIEDLEEVHLNSNDNYLNQENLIPGAYLKKWFITNSGQFEIKFDCIGTEKSQAKLIIYRKDENGLIDYEIYQSARLSFSLIMDLYKGDTIYFGYENGDCIGNIETSISRIENASLNLISDPYGAMNGSEVNLNGGSNYSFLMTVGFTRCIYLAPNSLDPSRLSYEWQTSNPNIAVISEYGTITAKMPGDVIIKAVYKSDLTIVGNLNMTILEDQKVEYVFLSFGFDVRESGTISGSEVTSGKGSIIKVGNYDNTSNLTIHRGYTRLICLGADSPSQNIQNFYWTVNFFPGEGKASVSEYGTITGIESGTVEIVGNYKFNSRFRVSIFIRVIV